MKGVAAEKHDGLGRRFRYLDDFYQADEVCRFRDAGRSFNGSVGAEMAEGTSRVSGKKISFGHLLTPQVPHLNGEHRAEKDADKLHE